MKINTTLEKVNAGLEAIIAKGGEVELDGSEGTVSIQGVHASFDFNQQTGLLIVKITDKPWLVSQDYIEGEIRKFFN